MAEGFVKESFSVSERIEGREDSLRRTVAKDAGSSGRTTNVPKSRTEEKFVEKHENVRRKQRIKKYHLLLFHHFPHFHRHFSNRLPSYRLPFPSPSLNYQ